MNALVGFVLNASRSLHSSTPSLLSPFVAALPLNIPSTFYTALAVLRPFTSQVTPFNASSARHAALAASFTMTVAGDLTAASLALSSTGIDTSAGLLNIPTEAGYRAFDVFYYLLTSASTPAEREFLSLREPASYALLNRSATYNPPTYIPTADDAASAEDFRASLKTIGIKGSAQRNLLSVLTGLLKLGDTLGFLVDAEVLDDVCEDVGGLLGIDPEVLARRVSTNEREVLIAAVYEALVDWIILKANEAIARDVKSSKAEQSSSNGSSTDIRVQTPPTEEEVGDTVCVTVLEIPSQDLGKAVALRNVFNDSMGINAEMREDGLEVTSVGSSVVKEMENALIGAAADLGLSGPSSTERHHEQDRKTAVLDKLGHEFEAGGFLHQVLFPVDGEGPNAGTFGRFNLPNTLNSNRVWFHLCLHPTDESPAKLAALPSTTSAWSAGTVSRQLRAWRLPEWANRRNKNLDFTADFEIDEFCMRYARLGCKEGRDGVESWLMEKGWSNGEVAIGQDRVWVREGVWWEAESMLDMIPDVNPFQSPMPYGAGNMPFGMESGYSDMPPGVNGSGFFPPMGIPGHSESNENILQSAAPMPKSAARSIAPTVARTINTAPGDYGLGAKGDETKGAYRYTDQDLGEFDGTLDPELGDGKHITSQPISASRRAWVVLVWALTFWIPSFVLRYIGRMKRPDVRMAWREKVVLIFLIFLLNATIVFYIVEFGNLLCPNRDKAWNDNEVATHTGDNDFYVSIHGNVYDITKFWTQTHGDTAIKANRQNMQQFGGQNLDEYFPPPLNVACRGLTTNDRIQLVSNATDLYSPAIHNSGPIYQPDPNSLEHSYDWYGDHFLPKIKTYYKGELVYDKKNVTAQGQQGRPWFILNGKVYDLTDYMHTLDIYPDTAIYEFFPPDVMDVIKNNYGLDISDQWKSTTNFTNSFYCLENTFLKGGIDFRDTIKCTINNYILLAFTIILGAVILIKFVAALQFGSKRRPAPQDKFVICQVPAYTEGEDQLRKGLDSLTALQYDNKRKLLFVICDGMIVGGGNDRPTPKIVLDILGVDPKIDPPALPFKSVGAGSEQLNYGKVYSGLYEFEGNVVPYVVVVKVGKEFEQSKSRPGNRGKRDSQILLMNFLNRVHYRAPMSPLELEIFHQINNIIGVDPELYEYLMMVDADTSVREDSLNRLVSSCANDAKIAGICGETSLENEGRSWWTMIQVYEYYISHHLAKAFESLFGSVTCLPGW